MTDIPLYYIDGPSAGKTYVDSNTVAGQRWRDGHGGCYEATANVLVKPGVGRVRIVHHVLCAEPPAGTIEHHKPDNGIQDRALYLGYDQDGWFAAYEDSATMKMETGLDEFEARQFFGALLHTYGSDTSWTVSTPQ